MSGESETILKLRADIERLTRENEKHTADIRELEDSVTDRDARIATLEAQVAEMTAALSDPNAVHLNVLRGTIARPSDAQLRHLIGDAANAGGEQG